MNFENYTNVIGATSQECKDQPVLIERKVDELDKKQKADWLLQSVKHLDLTSINSNDSKEKIRDLCLKAANPMGKRNELGGSLQTAAICIHPTKVINAVEIFKEENIKGINIASVGADFPIGKMSLEDKLTGIKEIVKNGADEIDVVINRDLVSQGQWKALQLELEEMRKACGKVTMKTILSTGELGNHDNIYMVSMLAMRAGSDFIKTSTGKEVVNATIPAGRTMCKAITEFYRTTKKKVGFKPAGGIRTANDVLEWFMVVKTFLGDEWFSPELFRIGASSVLDDIVKSYNSLVSEIE